VVVILGSTFGGSYEPLVEIAVGPNRERIRGRVVIGRTLLERLDASATAYRSNARKSWCQAGARSSDAPTALGTRTGPWQVRRSCAEAEHLTERSTSLPRPGRRWHLSTLLGDGAGGRPRRTQWTEGVRAVNASSAGSSSFSVQRCFRLLYSQRHKWFPPSGR